MAQRMSCAGCRRVMAIPLTREHIFPVWLRNRVQSTGGLFYRFDENGAIARQHDLDAYKVKRFCGECNNGWMERIDIDAEPILKQLLDDQTVLIATSLSQDEKLKLARWAAKTSYVILAMETDL
jgi:hypothetical protein